MTYTIRAATPNDIDHILPLFPRLADFDVPPKRNPQHLWAGDAHLLKQWGQGEVPNCLVKVATDEQNTVLGVAIVSLREELLSHEPSAHLEVLVIAKQADGQGLGKALLNAAEQAAQDNGAMSMTLHVFANNIRARHIYQKSGYSEELIRSIKHFDV